MSFCCTTAKDINFSDQWWIKIDNLVYQNQQISSIKSLENNIYESSKVDMGNFRINNPKHNVCCVYQYSAKQ